MTIWEQHKLERLHIRSVSQKAFIVRFINTYGAFFYIAFAEEYTSGCPEEGCLMQLRGKLIVVFICYCIFGAMDAIIPYIWFQFIYQRIKKMNPNDGMGSNPGMLEIQADMH